MGQVFLFPEDPKARERLERRKEWLYKDLMGKRPDGHPRLEFGPKGRVLLEVGQVWVECHTQRLVQITDIYEARKGFYPYDVVFAPYRNDIDAACLAESTFRQTHEVWDTWGDSQKHLMEKLDRMSATDPQSPFRNFPNPGRSARSFFGLDSNGNR